jgi:hypothetical protein
MLMCQKKQLIHIRPYTSGETCNGKYRPNLFIQFVLYLKEMFKQTDPQLKHTGLWLDCERDCLLLKTDSRKQRSDRCLINNGTGVNRHAEVHISINRDTARVTAWFYEHVLHNAYWKLNGHFLRTPSSGSDIASTGLVCRGKTFFSFLAPSSPSFLSLTHFYPYSITFCLITLSFLFLVTSVVILLLLPSGHSFTVQQFCHRSKAIMIIEDVNVCKCISGQCCKITWARTLYASHWRPCTSWAEQNKITAWSSVVLNKHNKQT